MYNHNLLVKAKIYKTLQGYVHHIDTSVKLNVSIFRNVSNFTKAWKGIVYSEFNKSGGPAGHQVRILWGPAEIYTVPVRMSDTIFLQY